MSEQEVRRDERGGIVLVALDGSPAAATALPVARLAAARLGAPLNVLHIPPQETPEDELRQQLGLDASGLRGVTIRAAAGDPAGEILRAAADPQIALLVLTTHGGMPSAPRPMGPVAEAVVAGAERPILLVRPAAAIVPGLRTGQTPRFLVPLDGTPTTAAALPPAIELARRLGGSLDGLMVVGPEARRVDEPGSYGAPMYVDQPQHEWPSWGREAAHRLGAVWTQRPPDVPLRLFIERGGIGEAVLRFAAEHHNDAIVLVRRSRLERGRGTVIREVLQSTPCPVLLISAAAPRDTRSQPAGDRAAGV